MSDVVALIGNPRPGSRTRTLAEATATSVVSALVAAGGPALFGVRVLELAEISAVSFGPGPAQPTAAIDDPHSVIRRARLLIVATPTYKGTYTGLLKIFLDQYGHRELAGVVAVPVAIAAAEPHRVAVAAALEPLLAELGATVPVPALAVLESALADPKQLAAQWATEHTSAIADALGPATR